MERRPSTSPYRFWIVSLLLVSLACLSAFATIDIPVARKVEGWLGAKEGLSTGFGSMVLVGIEASIALVLIVIRIVRGRLSSFGEAVALACLTSICAYAVNDTTLKHIFGVPNPKDVLQGAKHAPHFLKGTAGSSFPSGHMVLAGSFAGVFMRLLPKSVLPMAALLLLGAALLIMGDWHFVSDVIAGTFLGVFAGILAGDVWIAHSK